MQRDRDTRKQEIVNVREPQAVVTIYRSIDEVFEYLADGANDAAWMPWVTKCALTGYGGGAGATYVQSLETSPLHRRTLRYRVLNFHRPVLLSREATSLPGSPVGRFRLSAIGVNRTAVALTLDIRQGRLGELVLSAAERWTSQLVASLPQLKANLEARTG